jgi:small neutral amino acid transporter SnatA (MarC family)
MNIPLFSVGVLVLILTFTDTFRQGRLVARLLGKKAAIIVNTLLGIILIVLSFL